MGATLWGLQMHSAKWGRIEPTQQFQVVVEKHLPNSAGKIFENMNVYDWEGEPCLGVVGPAT